MKTHEKIQQAVIKAACKRETKNKLMRFRYGFMKHPGSESDLVIANELGTALYIVPRTYCFINTLYAFKGQSEINFRSIIEGAKEANTLNLTNKMSVKGSLQHSIFENKEGKEIHVDSKLLKTFLPTEEYTYTGTTKYDIVYVYDECQDLIGCICPILY